MRDPRRIKQVLKKLEKVWKKNPDLRLGQLVFALSTHSNETWEAHPQLFYTEDEIWTQWLNKELKREMESRQESGKLDPKSSDDSLSRDGGS